VDSLHVVASGKVAVSRKEKGSKTVVLLAELGPGKVFGETSILEMGTAGATVRAAEESLLFIIPQAAFLKAMADNSDLKARLLAKIAARPVTKPPSRD
jgi:CRP-like cAMP-binding protein